MKNLLLTLFISIAFCVSANADELKISDSSTPPVNDKDIGQVMSNAIMDDMSERAKKSAEAYKNMKSCMPAQTDWLDVYGFKGDKCHIRYVNYNCYLPMNITKQYADASLKILDSQNGSFNEDKESAEFKFIDGILNNKMYCSVQQ